MCKVEYIVEPIIVGGIVIVGETISDEDTVAFLEDKILAVNGPLIDLDSQRSW